MKFVLWLYYYKVYICVRIKYKVRCTKKAVTQWEIRYFNNAVLALSCANIGCNRKMPWKRKKELFNYFVRRIEHLTFIWMKAFVRMCNDFVLWHSSDIDLFLISMVIHELLWKHSYFFLLLLCFVFGPTWIEYLPVSCIQN